MSMYLFFIMIKMWVENWELSKDANVAKVDNVERDTLWNNANFRNKQNTENSQLVDVLLNSVLFLEFIDSLKNYKINQKEEAFNEFIDKYGEYGDEELKKFIENIKQDESLTLVEILRLYLNEYEKVITLDNNLVKFLIQNGQWDIVCNCFEEFDVKIDPSIIVKDLIKNGYLINVIYTCKKFWLGKKDIDEILKDLGYVPDETEEYELSIMEK